MLFDLQSASMAPVSLANVMLEQASGKGGVGTSPSTGILNPRGEYNGFLNVIVQALWHVVHDDGDEEDLPFGLSKIAFGKQARTCPSEGRPFPVSSSSARRGSPRPRLRQGRSPPHRRSRSSGRARSP